MDINFVIWSMRILQFFKWSNLVGLVLVFVYFVLIPLVNELSAETVVVMVYIVPMIIVNITFTFLLHFTAKGLSLKERWARYTTIGIGFLLLFGFPLGTIFGIFLLYAMLIDWPKQVTFIPDESSIEKSDLDLTPKQ